MKLLSQRSGVNCRPAFIALMALNACSGRAHGDGLGEVHPLNRAITCGLQKARNRQTSSRVAPMLKSKRFAHGKSRVIGNWANNSYVNKQPKETTNPTQSGQFHFRFMSILQSTS